MTTEGAPGLLDGAQLRGVFAAAAHHLREMASEIDAINVYPVPDGDTGANMSATLREAVEMAALAGDRPSVEQVLQGLARGALYGARGNSGVILSQALKGFATGVGDCSRFDAEGLARGLSGAARAAYNAVAEPAEGTMLTVLRIAAAVAETAASELPAGGKRQPCAGTLAKVIADAEVAEAATIDQLPALKEAGVPDAGGEGICVILRGLLAGLAGETPPVRPSIDRPVAVHAAHAARGFGFCTEFVVEPNGRPLDLDSLRLVATNHEAESLLVIGDEQAARLHAHVKDPHALVAAARALGRLSRLKIEDMSAQNVRFRQTGSGAGARIGVLALSRGSGFDHIFESLGAGVSDLGEVLKPPAGEIAAAADGMGLPDVIVLPNHANIILAANQAASLTNCTLHVIPTRSLPEGIAALMAFNAEGSVTENMAAMRRAPETVRTVEVTIAPVARTAHGIRVRAGQAIALVNHRLVAATEDRLEALIAGLDAANAPHAGLITIYGGAQLDPAELESVRESVTEKCPGVEVEALSGGQPLYPLIASVEL